MNRKITIGIFLITTVLFLSMLDLFAGFEKDNTGESKSDLEYSLKKIREITGQKPLCLFPDSKAEFYRFTLHDAGFTSAFIILIEKKAEAMNLSSWQVDLHDYYQDQGSGISRSKKKLTKAEWDQFKALFDQGDFWNYTETGNIGFDGSFWILEGCIPGRSRVIREWAPDPGYFRDLCLEIWKLSGLPTGNWDRTK